MLWKLYAIFKLLKGDTLKQYSQQRVSKKKEVSAQAEQRGLCLHVKC